MQSFEALAERTWEGREGEEGRGRKERERKAKENENERPSDKGWGKSAFLKLITSPSVKVCSFSSSSMKKIAQATC